MTGPTVAIVQARLSSTRLPGKVLADLGGRPLLDFLIARLRRARRIDRIVVATSDDPSDDALVAAMIALGHEVVRGSLSDVLSRYAGAADRTGAARIVRVTGDCPLIDPGLVDQVVAALDAGGDYAANTDPPSFPDGLDVEAFSRPALDRASIEARLPSEREHVTSWMRRPDNDLSRRSVAGPADLSMLRWTVDYPDDLAFVRAMVAAAGAGAVNADMFDYLRLQWQLGSSAVQALHDRNEGYTQSLAAERGSAGRARDK